LFVLFDHPSLYADSAVRERQVEATSSTIL